MEKTGRKAQPIRLIVKQVMNDLKPVDDPKKPKKIWHCIDCGTYSDDKTSRHYHVGHIGTRGRPTVKFFEQHIAKALPDGEVVWVKIAGHEQV